MAKTVRLNDETKDALDAYMAAHKDATGEDMTADAAVTELLSIAERHGFEADLTPCETESVATVRHMLTRVGDEMVSVLLHDKRLYDESAETAEQAIQDARDAAETLSGERDELKARVAELEPYVSETESLRAKVAEADETRANVERLLDESQEQKRELFESLETLMAETVRAREAAERERKRNAELQDKFDAFLDKLSTSQEQVNE